MPRYTLWYVQRSALTHDISIRTLSLSEKQRGKGEKRERERESARVMERRRSSKLSFALHACTAKNHITNTEYFRISPIVSRHPKRSRGLPRCASAASTQRPLSFADGVRRTGAARALGSL